MGRRFRNQDYKNDQIATPKCNKL